MIKYISKHLIRLKARLPRTHLNDFVKWSTLCDVLEKLRINCVFDVGANRGQFASTLRATGYQGRIVSFEPLPGEFGILSHRFRSDSLWRGMNYALGDEDCVMPFHNVVESTALSSFHGLKTSNRPVQVIPVTVKRLDDVYGQLVADLPNPRVFLKCDTQGFDHKVVSGANGIIHHILGMQSEIVVSSPYYKDTVPYYENLAKYEALGFGLLGTFDGAFHGKANAVGEIDCIMARVSAYDGP
jgi:FkbM family methyltransferase